MTDPQLLALIRGLHTAIYIVMAASVFAVLYAGVVGIRAIWLWPALALVTIEIVVFVGNGLKCPLTALVTRYSATTRPASDTFLPERVTRHTFQFFGPLIVIGIILIGARSFGILGWTKP